jgi:hypothetical protein
MAITAEQLNVILSARDREFTRAMDRAQRRVDRFANQSTRSLGNTTKAWAALASQARAFLPALSAGVIVSQARRVISELDEIGKKADAIGLTTEALQELRVNAEEAGVSQENLDNAMLQFSKRLGEARQGIGTARTALEDLNLSASELAQMPLDQALRTVADSMNEVEGATDRSALAVQLFGRQGVGMLNLLREGSEGMEAMAQNARDLGIIIDEDLIRNAEDAENQLGLMSRVISANLSQALINLAPILVGAAEGVALITQNIRYLFGAMDEGLARTQSLEQLGTQLQQINAQIEEAERSGGAVAVDEFNMGSSAVNLNQLYEQREAILARISGLQSEIAASQPPAEVITGGADLSALQSQVEAQEELARLAAMTAEERERARIEAEADALVQEALAQRQGDLMLPANIEAAIAAAELRDQYVAAATAASSILNPIQTAGGATRAVADAAEDAAESLEDVIQKMIEASPALQSLGFDAETLQSTMQTVEGSMESAFMSIMDGTASAKDAFRAMAADIIRELYRVLVVQRLVGSFAPGGGGILGSVFSAFGGATGAASGRPVQRGQPYTVGEHGRELFVPSSAGRVLSVPQAKAAVGGNQGQPVVVNYTFQGGVTEADLARALPVFVQRTKREIVDAVQRGGSMSRAFG